MGVYKGKFIVHEIMTNFYMSQMLFDNRLILKRSQQSESFVVPVWAILVTASKNPKSFHTRKFPDFLALAVRYTISSFYSSMTDGIWLYFFCFQLSVTKVTWSLGTLVENMSFVCKAVFIHMSMEWILHWYALFWMAFYNHLSLPYFF